MKLFLDPLDREKVENKIDAMASIYHKITTHKIAIDFSKPNSFQKKVLESKKAWATTVLLTWLTYKVVSFLCPWIFLYWLIARGILFWI